MSRIRSIHPGLWTDEAFMGLSPFARLFYIGLWNEAYDDGVFEWKPLTLKARIFPADNVDVPALLAELVEADCIRQGDGKYGLIRNFRVYQRPKKPNSSELLKPSEHEYVGMVRNQSSTGSEQDEQMEDVGGKREEVQNPPLSPQGGGKGDLFDKLVEAMPINPSSKLDRAEKWFLRQPENVQCAIVAAGVSFAAWFWPEQRRKGRSEAEALGFAPALQSWLSEGGWKSVSEIPSAQVVEPMVKLDRERDEALWLACEAVMGKKAPTSDGTWSFRKSVVEQARGSIALAGAA